MKASFKTVDLNGNNHLSLSGYYNRKDGNNGNYDDIQANICLLKENEKLICIISIDSVAIDSETTQLIRKILNQEYAIKPENVFLYATHTHSSYKALRKPENPLLKIILKDDDFDSEAQMYYNNFINCIIESIKEMKIDLKDCKVSYSNINVDKVGLNRNDPNGYFDNQCDVIKFESNDKIIGTFVIFGCHPTVLGIDNTLASGDYVSAMRINIQEQYQDTTILFLQGCAGEVSTRYTRLESSYQECLRIGEILACRVIDSFTKESIELNHVSGKIIPIEFKVRDFKTTDIKSVENHAKEVITQGNIFQERFRNAKVSDTIQSELSILDFGEVKIVNLPGEPFGEIGRDIKKTIGLNTIVCGYCNDYLGYLVSNEGLEKECYEKQMMLVTFDTHDVIVETLNLCNK